MPTGSIIEREKREREIVHAIRDLTIEMDLGCRRLRLAAGNRDATDVRKAIDNLDGIVKQLKIVGAQIPDEFIKTSSTGELYIGVE